MNRVRRVLDFGFWILFLLLVVIGFWQHGWAYVGAATVGLVLMLKELLNRRANRRTRDNSTPNLTVLPIRTRIGMSDADRRR